MGIRIKLQSSNHPKSLLKKLSEVSDLGDHAGRHHCGGDLLLPGPLSCASWILPEPFPEFLASCCQDLSGGLYHPCQP